MLADGRRQRILFGDHIWRSRVQGVSHPWFGCEHSAAFRLFGEGEASGGRHFHWLFHEHGFGWIFRILDLSLGLFYLAM